MHSGSFTSSPKDKGRKERRVSFLFRRSDGPEHCAGINSLLVSESGEHLWTASRDSLVKRWSLGGAQPALETNYEGHVDWVNDLALMGDLLVSCSSDRTLRIWPAGKEGHCIATLSSHSDYVTCMAAAPASGLLASGGLRGEVMLWDVATLKQVLQARQESGSFEPGKAEGVQGSVYAVAMDGRGALVAAGSTESSIRLVDARSGEKVMQLRGHSDNVRALALNGEGTLLLSGSSDHTLRLWDLGQQRCLHTFAPHTDSIWALHVDEAFGVAYSGGRDRCVYRTQLSSRTTELLLVESQPVRKLAVSPGGDWAWVATTSSSLSKWELDPAMPQPVVAAVTTPRGPAGAAGGGSGGGGGAQQRRAFLAPASTVQRGRMAFEGGAPSPPPQQQQPVLTLPGLPPLRHASVMTDRRHVLSQDEEGRVQLWDITAGAVVRDFGRCSLKDVERELFQPTHSVSPWFTLDCKLGNLAGHMETPQCFLAEIYAQDLGFSEAPVDLKINFGEHMLRALFRCWAERWAERHFPQSAGSSRQGSEQQEVPAPAPAGQQRQPQQQQQQQQQGEDEGMPDANGVDDGGGTAAAPPLPAFRIASRVPPVIMVWGGDGVPWRRCMQDFDGSEAEGSVIAQWVSDCVLRGQYPVGRELKTAFQLMPLEGSGLPSMLQSKLNAPRVLRVNKVADYIVKKMADQGVSLREEPLFWDSAKQQEWDAQQAAAGPGPASSSAPDAAPDRSGGGGGSRFSIRQLYGGGNSGGGGTQQGGGGGQQQDLPLLITCNGMVVPWDFSLAAVKQWIWKRSDDLVLNYSVRDASTPLRLPKIRPPI